MTKLNEIEKDALDALFVELSAQRRGFFEKIFITFKKFFDR